MVQKQSVDQKETSLADAKLPENPEKSVQKSDLIANSLSTALDLASHMLPGATRTATAAPEDEPDEPRHSRSKPPKTGMAPLKRLGIIATALGLWYSANGKKPAPDGETEPVPARIKVLETTLPTYEEESKVTRTDSTRNAYQDTVKGRYVDLSKVDLSQDFELVTERYRIIKEDDFFLTRPIGHIFSVPSKLLFWDSQVGWGLDAEGTKKTIAMLENREHLTGLTVRINNNGVWHDTWRLFFDEQVTERNGFLPRLFIGLPTTFLGEFFSETRRGDYYNPMTNTAVLYSNVPAISAHEIGHHQDFNRFPSDWLYSMGRAFPPLMLYQEYKASDNAYHLMAPEDRWQYMRYLVPAFATYVLACYAISKKMLKQQAVKHDADPNDVQVHQVLRHAFTLNADFQAGLYLYGLAASVGAPFLLSAGALAGGACATNAVLNWAMKDLMPYEHEANKRRGIFAVDS